jgi:Bifunctional DNA primase/polymerase, N-terminal
MNEAVTRRARRRARERMTAAMTYAEMGWPVCAGAHPLSGGTHSRLGGHRGTGFRGTERPLRTGRACSCDRVGCPDPGGHPISPAWQNEATVDSRVIARWWRETPNANVLLVTGRVFDVLDVPAAAGRIALDAFTRGAEATGPVAASGPDRYLFFVATRGAPDDEGEWWSCHLDCEPDSIAETPGLRWHCRDSYVLAPPSQHVSGQLVHWLRAPAGRGLPDSMRILPVLADACEEAGGS